MKKSKKLVFFGNERLATGVSTNAPTLRALVQARYEVAAVVSSHSESVSRSRRGLEIIDVAHAYHIPVLLPGRLSEIKDRLSEINAAAAVLVAFGKIIPQDIIDIFPGGIINIHPSLLPKLRGSTPVETAILNGLSETGVSLMKLTAEMDSGPVFAQEKIKLSGTESKPELAAKLLDIGSKLLIDKLPAILDGSIEPKVQDNSKATYTKLLKKEDGRINWHRPAIQLERQVRAFLAWPRSRAKVFGHEIIITKARVAKNQTDGALVMKANPGYLEILQLIAPSGKQMSGGDFKRGYLA